jgi:hypothetical protein
VPPLANYLDLSVNLGGEELRVRRSAPIPEDELLAASRKLGWPLPDDYRSCLVTYGCADILGAQLIHPSEWRARGEPLTEDPAGPVASFLPFARKPIPSGGELLFCFRFELDLRASAKDVAAFSNGEARPTFQGASYNVVACHLPSGLAGARLEASQRPMAPTFTAWVDQVITMVRARAAAAAH